MRNYLRELRENRKYSQACIAKKIKFSQQMYGFIENGERQQNISLDLLQKLAKALNVPLEELIEKELEYKQNNQIRK